MQLNKECLIELAELVVDQVARIAGHGKREDMAGHWDYEIKPGIITLHVQYKYHKDEKGLSVVLSYKGRDIANIQIKDTAIFNDAWSRDKLINWRVTTTSYVVRQFSKWISNTIMDNDAEMGSVRAQLANGKEVSWAVDEFMFVACYSKVKAGLAVYHRSEEVYSNVKNNLIGVTTDIGFQGLSLANIISEAERVIATILVTGKGSVAFKLED